MGDCPRWSATVMRKRGPHTTCNGGRTFVRRRGCTAAAKRGERRRSQAVAATKAAAHGGGCCDSPFLFLSVFL